jgi:UDP-N-acetylmuramate--alanine ligase
VITNVDKEHLDYFKTFENVKKAFKDFADKLPLDGHLIENTPINLKIRNLLQVPGEHNELNASQAFKVGRILDIDEKVILESLSEFKGTWRRFEVKQGFVGQKEIIVVSDYGHHPSEVAATLKAAREKYGAKKIWCVFQPHQYQRIYYLFDDFVKTFKDAKIDKIIITDIYDVAGREVKEISQDVSSKKIVDRVAKDSVIYLELKNIAEHLKQNMQTGDVLLIMGAGDIYKLVDEF